MNIQCRTIRKLIILILLTGFSSFASAETFDHFTTGFPLSGAHVGADCESCHTRGIFVGTPTRCESCHSLGGEGGTSAGPLDR